MALRFAQFGNLIAATLIVFIWTSSTPCRAADPFAELVRPTGPLSPAEELKSFHLPPGFKIQLVAQEPDLRKPMNMAFDVTGRLWFTESREYPFPAALNKPARDTIRILSDFDQNGKAGKVTIFAEGLNIPIGIYPFRTANKPGDKPTWKCIAWSIPNIWLFEDTDGDGKADKREILLGPLGWEADTHGNMASFRRGNDGWIYGTHGFNNTSHFVGRDGSKFTLNSGNTWRARLDGSHVEPNTHGQVNPFGLCFDPRGNLYSADCHSSPIYQLLPGGIYPSFGKPHDGLGYAPTTIQHSHNSTALCGIVYISDPSWPRELQNNILVGNVGTSRINRDEITFRGTSSVGKEMPDFLSTDDPWFRPVDLQFGPDGALYVADFYNKIIGHYEVPLTHPGRDRERGRIWRIVYKGKDGKRVAPTMALGTNLPELINELASENPTRRTLALHEICDMQGTAAVPELLKVLEQPKNEFQQTQTLWALQRLNALPINILLAAFQGPEITRLTALRIARELPDWPEPLTKAVYAAVANGRSPFEVRYAADALAEHPAIAHIEPLAQALAAAPSEDDHLRYSLRVALRNQFRDDAVNNQLWEQNYFAKRDNAALNEILPGLPSVKVARIRLLWLEANPGQADLASLQADLPQLTRELNLEKLSGLVALLQPKVPKFSTAECQTILTLLNAHAERGVTVVPQLREWAVGCVNAHFVVESPPVWQALDANGAPLDKQPWNHQERQSADQTAAQLISSFPAGENMTGILRSSELTLPTELEFYLAGHDGDPSQPLGKKNGVYLKSASDGRILREAAPPRNDIAQKIHWDLCDFAGQKAYLEVIDRDAGAAYAWLAIGRFSTSIDPHGHLSANPGQASEQRQLAIQLAENLRWEQAAPQLRAIAQRGSETPVVRAAAARALAAIQPTDGLPIIGALLVDPNTPPALCEQLAAICGERGTAGITLLAAALKAAPQKLQLSYATALAATPEGSNALLLALQEGRAATVLLRDQGLRDRLKAHKNAKLSEQIQAIVEKLPPANVQLDRLIAQRRAAFMPEKVNLEHGAEVFKKNCAACHQLDRQGAMIGPQLDGIGSRGPDRLFEDMLDPNRNVDKAFRASILTMNDGRVLNGLFRREEGETLIFADNKGQEFTVKKPDIDARDETATSLMPSIVETLLPADTADLIGFLLSKRVAK